VYLATVVQDILATRTLYDYGAQHPLVRRLAGRGVAYGVSLPNGDRIVIRHNRHGGALAPVQRDLFLPPTRAPYELNVSQRLRNAGLPTPEILAYAVYRAGPLLRRADVVTREIPDAFDLSVPLMDEDPTTRRAAVATAAALVRALSDAGARHHDLNVKNVLLQTRPDGEVAGYVLDVDRIEFMDDRTRARAQNLARLLRSAHKWRIRYGARVLESELTELTRLVSPTPSRTVPSIGARREPS
jgi:hypothetical protein